MHREDSSELTAGITPSRLPYHLQLLHIYHHTITTIVIHFPLPDDDGSYELVVVGILFNNLIIDKILAIDGSTQRFIGDAFWPFNFGYR